MKGYFLSLLELCPFSTVCISTTWVIRLPIWILILHAPWFSPITWPGLWLIYTSVDFPYAANTGQYSRLLSSFNPSCWTLLELIWGFGIHDQARISHLKKFKGVNILLLPKMKQIGWYFFKLKEVTQNIIKYTTMTLKYTYFPI
jgi:hypothetical protein